MQKITTSKWWQAFAGVLTVLVLAFVEAPVAQAEYGDIVINNYSDAAGMRPVVFPHWFHRLRFRCKVCHADLGFKFKAGGNDINMVKIIDGQLCGACHNGDTAWSVENCNLCHTAKPGTPTQVHESTIQKLAQPTGITNKKQSTVMEKLHAVASMLTGSTAAKVEEAKPESRPVPASQVAATPASAATAAAIPATPEIVAGSDPLSFNRLLKPASKRNLPPWEDGIHDPANDGTHALLAPLSVLNSLPRDFAGNRVDWVRALENGVIKPRTDRLDPAAEMLVMDLNVVREVKGTMPDVVYPHKQHTEWLDCSNCHAGIFIPQKGANAISMAAILLGEKCGVCHGTVAFPVSECRKCHFQKKESKPTPAAAVK